MTLLPNKHIEAKRSLLGLGALLLLKLEKPSTITGLWERCRENPDIGSFERFTASLDLLYLLGAVGIDNSILVRTHD